MSAQGFFRFIPFRGSLDTLHVSRMCPEMSEMTRVSYDTTC